MTAVYPGAIKAFTPPVVKDAEDMVYAAHINDLREEVVAVETELGTGLKSSSWSVGNTSFTTATSSWPTLAQRLVNIENGLVTTNDVHTQYVKRAGDSLTGNLTMGGSILTNLGNGSAATDSAAVGQVVLRNGTNAMTGDLSMGTSYKVTNAANGSVATDGATVGQVLLKNGGNTPTANLPMGGFKLTGLGTGSSGSDSLRYDQVLASGTTLISGLFSASNPAMNGTASVGSSAQPARSDHIHPTDTSKVSRDGSLAMTGALTLAGNPSSALQAAPKQYVDGAYVDAANANANANNRVAKTGDWISWLGVSGNLSVGATTTLAAGGGSSLYLGDLGIPQRTPVTLDSGWRWLVYANDGRVYRFMENDVRSWVIVYGNASSIRFKDNVTDETDVPDPTLLRPRAFDWKENGSHENIFPGRRVGLIAEEVHEVDDRLTIRDEEGSVTGLDTNALIASLIAKVTDLQNRIEVLEAQ